MSHALVDFSPAVLPALTAQPAPYQTAPSTAAPSAPAAAPAAPSTTSFLGSMVLPFVLVAAVLFFTSRSANKERDAEEQMRKSLQKGDEVLTRGGIVGKVLGFEEPYALVEIADRVKIRVERTAIVRRLNASESTGAPAATK